MYLEENIKGIFSKHGVDYPAFLGDMNVENVKELSIFDLEAIADEYGLDLYALCFKPLLKTNHIAEKLKKIKLLILDVDGVMTDGGMYVTELGDQMKKFNTKDGMAIMHLTKSDFQVAIISSGFKTNAINERAQLLGIQNCIVTRDKKIDVLSKLLVDLNISMENVAMIGDDINDSEVLKQIGFAACPSDAVQSIKNICHAVLEKKGGEGCVREFIDTYLLNEPLN